MTKPIPTWAKVAGGMVLAGVGVAVYDAVRGGGNGGAAASPAKPANIAITAISVDPPEIKAGQTLTAVVTILNRGGQVGKANLAAVVSTPGGSIQGHMSTAPEDHCNGQVSGDGSTDVNLGPGQTGQVSFYLTNFACSIKDAFRSGQQLNVVVQIMQGGVARAVTVPFVFVQANPDTPPTTAPPDTTIPGGGAVVVPPAQQECGFRTPAGSNGQVYTVKPGDSFSGIAQRYGVSTGAMIAANRHISNPDLICPGDVLLIPSSGTNPSPQLSQATPQIVSAGVSPSVIKAGQQLTGTVTVKNVGDQSGAFSVTGVVKNGSGIAQGRMSVAAADYCATSPSGDWSRVGLVLGKGQAGQAQMFKANFACGKVPVFGNGEGMYVEWTVTGPGGTVTSRSPFTYRWPAYQEPPAGASVDTITPESSPVAPDRSENNQV